MYPYLVPVKEKLCFNPFHRQMASQTPPSLTDICRRHPGGRMCLRRRVQRHLTLVFTVMGCKPSRRRVLHTRRAPCHTTHLCLIHNGASLSQRHLEACRVCSDTRRERSPCLGVQGFSKMAATALDGLDGLIDRTLCSRVKSPRLILFSPTEAFPGWLMSGGQARSPSD